MKYGYMVKLNGKWYLPDEEIPETKKDTTPETENVLTEPEKKESKKRN